MLRPQKERETKEKEKKKEREKMSLPANLFYFPKFQMYSLIFMQIAKYHVCKGESQIYIYIFIEKKRKEKENCRN